MAQARSRSWSPALRLAVTLGLALVVVAAPAGAHSEVPGFRHVIDEVTPPAPPGITVDVVVSAAAQVVARNTTPTALEVVAEGGEPFLRIGPDGVEANLSSPDWYRSATPEGDGRVPADAAPAAAPRWVRVSAEPAWGWFDHRLHASPSGARTAPGAEGSGAWVIPLRHGTREIVVRGHREYSRPTGRFRATLDRAPAAVRAGVVDGTVPAVSVALPSGRRTLLVVGREGEPMARVGPDGVEANLASPTWRLTAAAAGAVSDGPVGAGEAPRWSPVGAGSTLTWLEPRARYAEAVPPAAVIRSDRPQVLLRWEVPLELDGERTSLVGSTAWVPEAGASRSGGASAGSDRRAAIAVAAVAIPVGAAVAFTVGRRRRAWLGARGGRRGR